MLPKIRTLKPSRMLAKRSRGRMVENSSMGLIFSGGICLRMIWPSGTSHNSSGIFAPVES